MSMGIISLVGEDLREHYRTEGYFILESVIPEAHLELLRAECERLMDVVDAEMDQRGTNTAGINHRSNRYFISNRHKSGDRLGEFLYSDLMAEICHATLGDEAFLFHEQFVVKAAEKGMPFAWHQDSGYIGYPHRPYLTCWCALDDVNEENGTVYILPRSRSNTEGLVEHTREKGTNDLVGYHGDDPGIPVIVPAGSIAVFSSLIFHRSGRNTTDKLRRVYLPQYSAEPIYRPDGGLHAFGIPLLHDGKNVAAEQQAHSAAKHS